MARQFDQKKWLLHQLRRLSLKYPPSLKVLNAAKHIFYIKSAKNTDVKRVTFTCNVCKKEGFKSKEVNRDHKEPVIDPAKGFTDWNDYINRLFCTEDNFQIICVNCHDIKTRKENVKRLK